MSSSSEIMSTCSCCCLFCEGILYNLPLFFSFSIFPPKKLLWESRAVVLLEIFFFFEIAESRELQLICSAKREKVLQKWALCFHCRESFTVAILALFSSMILAQKEKHAKCMLVLFIYSEWKSWSSLPSYSSFGKSFILLYTTSKL